MICLVDQCVQSPRDRIQGPRRYGFRLAAGHRMRGDMLPQRGGDLGWLRDGRQYRDRRCQGVGHAGQVVVNGHGFRRPEGAAQGHNRGWSVPKVLGGKSSLWGGLPRPLTPPPCHPLVTPKGGGLHARVNDFGGETVEKRHVRRVGVPP